MKWLFVSQHQNSDVREVDWRPAESRLVMWLFTSLPNIQVPPPDTPPAVNIFYKQRLKSSVNAVPQGALLAEKPNDHPLVVLHPPGQQT
jgi:hypothetical protein